jgi:GrpB-like predicted nucleotidyltransferase (UPF0157 family)
MNRLLLLIFVVLVGFAWNSPAYAFGGERAFYDFLRDHPEIRHELESHPDLASDPAYIRDHPQFREFFRNHDEVRGELARNAPEIMRREETDMAHPRDGH